MSANGFIRSHQNQFSLLYRISDGVIIFCSLFALAALAGESLARSSAWVAISAVALFALVGESVSLYRSWRLSDVGELMATTLMSWLAVAALVVIAIYALDGYFALSRLIFLQWMLLVPALLCGWRLAFRQILFMFRRVGFNSRKAAIIGMNETGLAVAQAIAENPSHGIHLVGIYDDRSPERLGLQDRTRLSGGVDDVIDAARRNEIDLICIAMPLRAEQRTLSILERCRDTTADVHIVPDLLVYQVLHSRWHAIGGIQTLNVCDTAMNGISGWLKRLEDLVLASIILTLIALPMLLIAIGVKLSSKGPVLFKQDRYGMDGSRIKVWKFRTMKTLENDRNVRQAVRNDPRVTPFGAFLRRTSLDELPQFINVLQGTMSIVGPRPHAVAHNEQYRTLISGYMLRHKVKPGITGWAQVNGWRGETDTLDKMQHRVEFDLAYIKNWSLGLDFRILGMTLVKGFSSSNAY